MSLSARKPSQLRLFFALWPTPEIRAELAALRSATVGRQVNPANLHLTLSFLGQQPAASVPTLLAIAESIEFPPMQLVIDRLGYFKRNRIAWAGMHEPPRQLMTLRRDLNDALIGAGIDFKAEHSFTPHVTLTRDASAPTTTAVGPLIWNPTGIVLVSSVAGPKGVVYQVVER